MLKRLKKDRIRTRYEELYPRIYSICIVIMYLLLFKDGGGHNFDNILNAVISFVSIMIGFIAALVTLIFSLLNTEIIQIIFGNTGYRTRLKRFFLCSCQSGFFILGDSIVLFARQDIFTIIEKIVPNAVSLYLIEGIKIIWVYFLAYFIISSYRVISLMIQVAFEAPKQEEKDDETTNIEIQELRKKYER